MQPRKYRFWQSCGRLMALPLIIAIAVLVISSWQVPQGDLATSPQVFNRRATGQAQLTSIYRIPEMAGEMCELEPASAASSFIEMLQQQQAEARSLAPTPTAGGKTARKARKPGP